MYVGNPPTFMIINFNPEFDSEEGRTDLNPALYDAEDDLHFSSQAAMDAFLTVKAAALANPNRTITLDDIHDSCLGADKIRKTGGNASPTPTGDMFIAKAPIDLTYYIGSEDSPLPPMIQASLNKNLSICDNISRSDDPYEMRSQIYSCKKAVRNVLMNGAQNGLPQDGYAGFEGSTTVWVGSNAPDSPIDLTNKDSYPLDLKSSRWAKPNGEMKVTGEYTYTFTPGKTSDTVTQIADTATDNISDNVRKNLQTGINTFINAYIVPTGGTPIVAPENIPENNDSYFQNLCKTTTTQPRGEGQDPFTVVPPYCSLTSLSSSLVGAAQAQTELEMATLCKTDPADARCSLDLETYTIKTIPEYTTDDTYKGQKLTPVQTCTPAGKTQATPLMPSREIPSKCTPLVNGEGKQLYIMQREIEVPLQHSWWNAGASYLIIDNQFAENTRALLESLKRNAATLVFSGTATGHANINLQIMIEQRLPLVKDQTGLATFCYKSGDIYNCDGSTGTGSAGTHDRKYAVYVYGPADLDVDVQNLRPNDFGIAGDYISLIQPYNPEIEPSTNPNDPNDMYRYRVSNTSKTLYAELTQVPPDMQDPLVRLLLYAQAESKNPDSACSSVFPNASSMSTAQHNCFQKLTPYLSNLMNVMTSNNLVGNVRETLPMNAAMDSMFVKLMGDVVNSRTGGTIYGGQNQTAFDTSSGMTSIMNEIYNFGYTDPDLTNIAAQQFSLIQQIRNTGIDTLVSCISSMQGVFGHFQGAVNNLMNSVDNVVNNGAGAQAKNTAIASAAMYGAAAGFGITSSLTMAASMSGVAAASGMTVLGTGATGAGAAAQLAAKIPELITTGLGLTAQALQVTSTALQTQAELAIATDTITTISQLGIQLMWLPVFLFVITSLISIGVQFAFVIPFMPYMMFWAGQMAWVIGVIEALVAAPLVMLAFAHPGGNDYLGHAAPAVRFLLGIVFRPVLMVIGMLTGILLTYVLIHYSAEGFHIIANSTFNSLDLSNIILSGAISTLLVLMYASFLMMAFTKCFSPIYVLPEKVVQWINGQADRAGEAEAQQFGQHAQQTAQQGAQAGGQALQQGIDAQKQQGQGHSDVQKQSMGSDISIASKSGEIGGKTAGDAIKFSRDINKNPQPQKSGTPK